MSEAGYRFGSHRSSGRDGSAKRHATGLDAAAVPGGPRQHLKRELADLSLPDQLQRVRPEPVAGPPLQLSSREPKGSTETVRAAGLAGLEDPSGPLPFLAQIQRSFGRHDVGQIKAHVGSAATAANEAMGATAYATGNRVAFRGAPDLRTAAHEAAHVVQQRSGIHLKGGIGEAADEHERNADAVADAVVQNKSAEELLKPYAGRQSDRGDCVQMLRVGVSYPGGRLAISGSEITAQRTFSILDGWSAQFPIGSSGGIFIFSGNLSARIGGLLDDVDQGVNAATGSMLFVGSITSEIGVGLPYILSATIGGGLVLMGETSFRAFRDSDYFTTTAFDASLRGGVSLYVHLPFGITISFPLTASTRVAVLKMGDYDSRTGEYEYLDFEIPDDSPLHAIAELIERIIAAFEQLFEDLRLLVETLAQIGRDFGCLIGILEEAAMPIVAYFQHAMLLDVERHRPDNIDVHTPPWQVTGEQERAWRDQALVDVYESLRLPTWRCPMNHDRVEYFDRDAYPDDILWDWLINVWEEVVLPLHQAVENGDTGLNQFHPAFEARAGSFFTDPREPAAMAVLYNEGGYGAFLTYYDITEMSIREFMALVTDAGWVRSDNAAEIAQDRYRGWLCRNGISEDPLTE